MISAVVLAAGRAERMGRQKLLLPLGDKPVLQWVLESALGAAVGEVLCVARRIDELRQKMNLVDRRLRWVVNEQADRGQSTSVIAGLREVDPQSEAAVFLVGDQPMVPSALIDALGARLGDGPHRIVAPVLQGETRSPVLFRRDLFPELFQLTGDRGGRALIRKHPADTVLVEWHDELPFLDLDVPEDYEKLKRLV